MMTDLAHLYSDARTKSETKKPARLHQDPYKDIQKSRRARAEFLTLA
jgi:hypothetical protein